MLPRAHHRGRARARGEGGAGKLIPALLACARPGLRLGILASLVRRLRARADDDVPYRAKAIVAVVHDQIHRGVDRAPVRLGDTQGSRDPVEAFGEPDAYGFPVLVDVVDLRVAGVVEPDVVEDKALREAEPAVERAAQLLYRVAQPLGVGAELVVAFFPGKRLVA